MLPSAGPAIRESPPPLIPTITSSADAIFIRCTNYRTIDFIERLEEELRESVVRRDPAIFWAAFLTIGCRERIRGFRKVLRAFELSAAGRNYGDVSSSPRPPLGRLAPRRCRLALTPGRPPQNGGLRAGDGLARGRGVSSRPGGPGLIRSMNTSSNLRH